MGVGVWAPHCGVSFTTIFPSFTTISGLQQYPDDPDLLKVILNNTACEKGEGMWDGNGDGDPEKYSMAGKITADMLCAEAPGLKYFYPMLNLQIFKTNLNPKPLQ